MSAIQKRNKAVDKYKDKWALMHGIPIIRIWEKDIHENPKMVMETLKGVLNKKEELLEKKNKRHINNGNKYSQKWLRF